MTYIYIAAKQALMYRPMSFSGNIANDLTWHFWKAELNVSLQYYWKEARMMLCNICPRACNVDREKTAGFCGMRSVPVVARAFLHMWEEPCISGTRGSGAVFFSGCNLKCIFCQNHEISHGGHGREISAEELAAIFLSLRDQGAHNINLVTPSHYIHAILEALKIAKTGRLVEQLPDLNGAAGQSDAAEKHSALSKRSAYDMHDASGQSGVPVPLDIPIVYNTSGYDSLDSLKMLEGSVDIYLPDLKYISSDVSLRYSGAKDYFEKASCAIMEMCRQAGAPVLDENGIMKSGVIIRHLVLPGHVSESLQILDWIAENLPADVPVSLMSQYVPCYKATEHAVLGRRLTRYEYEKVINRFVRLGLKGFYQERGAASEAYIPDFSRQE